MTTKLDKPLRREIQIEDRPYTLTVDADGLKLVEKGAATATKFAGPTWSAAMPRCRRR